MGFGKKVSIDPLRGRVTKGQPGKNFQTVCEHAKMDVLNSFRLY